MLFKNVISDDHTLHNLLPPKRCLFPECKHDFILPRVKTERFEHCSLNICLFNSLHCI